MEQAKAQTADYREKQVVIILVVDYVSELFSTLLPFLYTNTEKRKKRI
jgi:hypothetical protein